MPRFGELRLVRDDVGTAARLLYRVMGVADPAHYLHHLYVAHALESLGDFQPSAILDAGCGRGDHAVWLARRFPGATVLGVDLERPRIEANAKAIERLALGNLRFEPGDLTLLELVDAMDLVVSVDVLEHIVEQQEAMRRLLRALRPGGYAILHVPTRRLRPVPLSGRLGSFHEWAEHEHLAEEATASEFVERVRQAGFEIHSSRQTFGYWTGELATSIFALFHRDTLPNRVAQAAVAPLCRSLVLLDGTSQRERYAVCVVARRPAPHRLT